MKAIIAIVRPINPARPEPRPQPPPPPPPPLALAPPPDPAAVTVTFAVLVFPPLVAVTVYGPPVVVLAVNNPVLLSVPRVVADSAHVAVGWTANAALNCSFSEAVNGWVAEKATVADAGVTATLDAV